MKSTILLFVLPLLASSGYASAQTTTTGKPGGEGQPGSGADVNRTEGYLPPETQRRPRDEPPPPAVIGSKEDGGPEADEAAAPSKTGPHIVTILEDEAGWKLQVDGRDFMVFGMNWGYMPIGENYSYDFWGKPDDFIEKALDSEMTLLRAMGVNTIRQYIGIPPRWIEYIYREYGIFTVLNHPMGRYGHVIDGTYVVPTNYADERTREVITQEIVELVKEYENTPGLLMWLLGNENNYGLYWASAEIENLPDMNQEDARAKYLYTLYGQIIDEIHAIDDKHPVAIANGDLQFLDQIEKYAGNLDVMGSNVYRGYSSGDLFERVREELGVPFMYTEFGSDAYNAKEKREDHLAQAEYLRTLWQEIYEQSYGKGREGNAIGGMTFQWSDGWWKYRQEVNLDVHDTTASWGNAAYEFDYVEGQNNMNEEWFGICAKGRPDDQGLYRVFPRAGYYVLREGYQLDPYGPGVTLERIREHWSSIRPKSLGANYEVSSLGERMRALEMVRAVNLTMQFETFTTGGVNLDDEERAESRFDHLESFFMDFLVQPTNTVRAQFSLNVLGNVPANPIDEIFFEDRGQDVEVLSPDGEIVTIDDIERVKAYQAYVDWREEWFRLQYFYRRGHYHWAYEGDFFGLYPEANYEPQVDMFNANTPNGFEFAGRKALDGLKIAFGPEIYWGANPTIIGKYYREIGRYKFSLMHQEDIAQRANAPTSSVIPLPRTRKTTLFWGMDIGKFTVEVGGIMAGTDRLGQDFTMVRELDDADGGYLESGYEVLDDEIDIIDTFGTKAKITYQHRNLNLYIQGGYRGLVADGGWDPTITFTGWSLRDTGRGNNYNFFAGGAYNFGNLQVAPNFMFQKPLEGPLPFIDEFFDSSTGTFFPAVRPRNQLEDPFWVRGNRETIGFEMLLSYDPTPATWAWAWDSVFREDAKFSAFVDFTYRILPTSQDAGVGVSDEGFLFAFPGAPPAQDLWEVRGRAIFNPAPKLRIVSVGYGGIAQSTGDSDRLLYRGGGDVRLIYDHLNFEGGFKINDWGPYDFQRDFNLTFPFQALGDLSYSLFSPAWFVRAYTRFGARFKFRTLDINSPRYALNPDDPDRLGIEWEVKSYVHISL